METENEKKTIKYLDLKAINAPYEEEIKKEINQVVSSGWYLQGRCVKQFEKNYANFIGTEYCISCGNGLDALKLILMGEMAIGKLHQGDEILVPANTYIATILSITSVGLVPILVEPNPETLQIDENLIESNISYKTRGIMLVHLYGKLSWTERIQEICKENDLLIFEDNAQAFGCGYVNSSARETIRRKLNQEDEDITHQNQIDMNITYQDQIEIIGSNAIQKSICHTGALGNAGAHSFYPSKNLGALGDAGAVTTDDEELAEAIRALHDYGRTSRFDFEYQGINSRMDEIQAAVLNVKLRHPHDEHIARCRKAMLYMDYLHPAIVERCIPKRLLEDPFSNVLHIFPFITEERMRLREFLKDESVETAMHYPIPPNEQLGYPELRHYQLPITQNIACQELSLPCNSTMRDEEVIRVAQLINDYFLRRNLR